MPTLTREQFKQLYGDAGLAKFGAAEQPTAPVRETMQDITQTASNIKGRFTTAADKSMDIIRQYRTGQQGAGSTALQLYGQGAGALTQSVGDVFVGLIKGTLNQKQEEAVKEKVKRATIKVMQHPAVDQTLKASIEKFQSLPPEQQENIRALYNTALLYLDGIGIKSIGPTVRATRQVAQRGVQRGVDLISEGIAGSRNLVRTARLGREVAEEAGTQAVKTSTRFTENPAISGTIDDIKNMVGLPESTPAVDLTFRAVKPRLTKKVNLRRVKDQMALANQTIVEQGFKPTTIREYADAIALTKKQVWTEIAAQLSGGQDAGVRVNLAEIAMKILNKADDPALARVNPKAAKQLEDIAENLVSQGDDVDILTAEKVKQLLNAELDDAFGTTDLSQQAKEAKKLITVEIGKQLDDKLSVLPNEFRDLKIKYGSLSAIEDDVLKRAIVFERQNPEGLADMLTKAQVAADIAFGGMKGKIRGVARLMMQRQLKKANDANELVRRAFEKLSATTGRELDNLVDLVNKNQGLTYNIIKKQDLGGKKLTSVSIYPERSKVVKTQAVNKDEIKNYINANKDLLDRKNHALGVWYDPKTGEMWLDVAVAIPDEKRAIELGKQFNQKEIWSLERGEPIDIGGTGEVVDNLPSIAERINLIENIKP